MNNKHKKRDYTYPKKYMPENLPASLHGIKDSISIYFTPTFYIYTPL
ncbi:hypothetical protein RG47T_4920 [Mucilaginibacter polytrichastri]|uniref:Uncharacterized protein n=1 Tax=Mucilaginibacter polytrichastri TaxID=1302689 RepID=A0A1Q6A616_9SPHI|nr:hypothetical protein RG47T_4920 [Mucilaginibacter polytrichastri]